MQKSTSCCDLADLTPGDLVKITCSNKLLDGKTGTLLLKEKDEGFIFGTCVLIEGAVYGFSPEEVTSVSQLSHRLRRKIYA